MIVFTEIIISIFNQIKNILMAIEVLDHFMKIMEKNKPPEFGGFSFLTKLLFLTNLLDW